MLISFKCTVTALAATALLASATNAAERSEIPLMASDALKIAWSVAAARGRDVTDDHYKMDITAKPLSPGYTTTQLFANGDLIDEYSINLRTLQVVGISACEYFAFPSVEAVKAKVLSPKEREADRPLQVLAEQVGCDRLTVISPKRK